MAFALRSSFEATALVRFRRPFSLLRYYSLFGSIRDGSSQGHPPTSILIYGYFIKLIGTGLNILSCEILNGHVTKNKTFFMQTLYSRNILKQYKIILCFQRSRKRRMEFLNNQLIRKSILFINSKLPADLFYIYQKAHLSPVQHCPPFYGSPSLSYSVRPFRSIPPQYVYGLWARREDDGNDRNSRAGTREEEVNE